MSLFQNVFRKKQEPAGELLTPLQYIQTHKPGKAPMQDVLHLVQLWMDSAQPVSAESDLVKFMDSFAQKWGVSWKKGDPEKVYAWFKQCAQQDHRQKDEQYQFYGIDGPYGEYVVGPYHEYGLITMQRADWWSDYHVAGSALEVGVCGAYHVIGKASGKTFFYLAHQ